mgnify:CR=1 FL=1
MSDILIQDVDPALKMTLEERARANHRSLSDEVKALVEKGLREATSRKGLGSQIHELFADIGGVELELPPREPVPPPPEFS